MSSSRAVISSDSTRDYAFSTVIASLFWKHLIGYEPIVLLAEDEHHWLYDHKRHSVALKALRHHNIDVRFIGHIDGYETPRIGQNAREHAAVLDLPEDTWLINTDADLYPLDIAYHRQHEGSDWKAMCLNGHLDHFVSKEDALEKIAIGKRFQTIPSSCVIMRVKDWRESYGYKAGTPLNVAIKETLDGWVEFFINKGNKADNWKNFDLFMMDQDIVTHRMCRMPWFPSEVRLVGRPGGMRRLDRGGWDESLIGYALDAHVFNAPDRDGNWQRIRKVIEHYIPSQLAWCDEYREEFRNSYVD